ncbi:MAG TPA: FGGY family carbohydrate kinase [Thermoanaerobaculia bacterium]|nr:FGGY family carbohydrate kinase [Thermoanaerobaculia bacterium]
MAGVDCSTQSTTVEVRDASTGELIASGSAPHPPVTPPVAEQHPDAWWRAFEHAWAEAGAPKVAAISVAAQQHGMVALGAGGEVLRPAVLWCDTTSAEDAARLVERLEGGAAAWAERCGLVPVASFTISKLARLRRVEPDVYSRLERVCLPHDWLTHRLTGGEPVTDRGDASGTGYWSSTAVAARERSVAEAAPTSGPGGYVESLLDLVDPERDWTRALPRVLGPSEPAGRWREQGALVGPGTGDNMGAALGLGVGPGELVLSIGTSGTAYVVSEAPVADASGAVASFADATGRFLPLVCTLNAAKVTDAVARLLGVDHEGLDRLALAATPDVGELVLLPYFDGERTPNRPHATGVLAGLRSDATREQVARAAFEGVVCGLLDAVDALARLAPIGDTITLVGGGARSEAYRRILADLSGRAVVTPELGETVALGACVQAAAVLDGAPPEAVRATWQLGSGRLTEPDPRVPPEELRARYRKRREREDAE